MSNDGYSSDEAVDPPMRRELKEEEKLDLAYDTWLKTGSRGKVKRALGLKTDRAANLILNRAVERYRDERSDKREALFEFMDTRFTGMLSTLIDEFDLGARDRINEIIRVADRLAKLHGTDTAREIEAGGVTCNINVALPEGVGEVVDGTAVDVPREALGAPGESEGA